MKIEEKYIPSDAKKVYTTYIHQVKGLQESLALGEDHVKLFMVDNVGEMLALPEISASDICVVGSNKDQNTYMNIAGNNYTVDDWKEISSTGHGARVYKVDSDLEMLLLTPVYRGDICIRVDLEESFVNATGVNANPIRDNWELLIHPETNHKHVYETIAIMLSRPDGEIEEGDICLVYGDPVLAKNGDYLVKRDDPVDLSDFIYVGVEKHDIVFQSPDVGHMLGLPSLKQGDVCYVTDIKVAYKNLVGDNGDLDDWQELGSQVIISELSTMQQRDDLPHVKIGDICTVQENGNTYIVGNDNKWIDLFPGNETTTTSVKTFDDLNSIKNMKVGDVCFVQYTKTSYMYSTTSKTNRWLRLGDSTTIVSASSKADMLAMNIDSFKTGDICFVYDENITYIFDKYLPTKTELTPGQPVNPTKSPGWRKILAPVKISSDDNNYLEVGSDNYPYVNGLAIEQHLGPNLFYNGDGGLEDNTNFPGWTYDKKYHKIGKGGFYHMSKTAWSENTRYITIDIKQDYVMSGWIQAPTVLNERVQFMFIRQYDVDYKIIQSWMGNPALHNNKSETTLSKKWTPGDKIMHVTDLSNWHDYDTKRFLLYPYESSEGTEYPVYEYSRHTNVSWGRHDHSWRPKKNYVIHNTVAGNHYIEIEVYENANSLHNPKTNDGSWPTGTPIKQVRTGGTIYYPWAGRPSKLREWEYKKGYFDKTKFWYGLNHVRTGFLKNHISEYHMGTNAATDPSDVAWSGLRFVETDELAANRASHGIFDIDIPSGTTTPVSVDIFEEAMEYKSIRFIGDADSDIVVELPNIDNPYTLDFINDTGVKITINQIDGSSTIKSIIIPMKTNNQFITERIPEDISLRLTGIDPSSNFKGVIEEKETRDDAPSSA